MVNLSNNLNLLKITALFSGLFVISFMVGYAAINIFLEIMLRLSKRWVK